MLNTTIQILVKKNTLNDINLHLFSALYPQKVGVNFKILQYRRVFAQEI